MSFNPAFASLEALQAHFSEPLKLNASTFQNDSSVPEWIEQGCSISLIDGRFIVEKLT